MRLLTCWAAACGTALWLLILPAPAQELGSAAVDGTVVDDSGAVVPAATVLLREIGRGLDRTDRSCRDLHAAHLERGIRGVRDLQ